MDPAHLVEIMGEYETLVEKVSVLGAYPELWFAAETQSLTIARPTASASRALLGVPSR